MKGVFSAVAVVCMSGSLSAEVYPALHDVSGVAADDVLNVRAAPDAKSAIIGAFAPDAEGIEVVGRTGSWGRVNVGDVSGYAALRYLERSDGPDWNALETSLTCVGTEPFWSLRIDPAQGETRFQTPEDPEPDVAPITAVWPALPWASTAALSLPDGLAVLSPADCSDGMSNRVYGISADLFLNGAEGARLAGCCRVGDP